MKQEIFLLLLKNFAMLERLFNLMKINSDISYTIIDNQTLITSEINKKSYILDNSGTLIWKLILDNKNKNIIVDILSEKFPDYKEDIIIDVDEIFTFLVDNNILVNCDEK